MIFKVLDIRKQKTVIFEKWETSEMRFTMTPVYRLNGNFRNLHGEGESK
jgi:hypothetical protein